MNYKLNVNAFWDEEAKVWVASSDDIPGLVTEAESLDKLLERIIAVAPELLADNVSSTDVSKNLEMCIVANQHAGQVHID